MVHLITQQVGSYLSNLTMNQICSMAGHDTTHAVATTTGEALVAKISVHLVHLLISMLRRLQSMHNWGIALKTALISAIHVTVAHSILTGLTASLLALFAGQPALVAQTLTPVVALYAGRQLTDFPRNLAAQVTPTVAANVMRRYRSTNQAVMEKLFEYTVKRNVQVLAKWLAEERDFVDKLYRGAKVHLNDCNGKRINLDDIQIIEVKAKTDNDDCLVM